MKKKTRTPAPRAAKRRQGGAVNRKPASQRPSATSVPRPSPEASGDGKAEIRRLRTELAQAVARIEQLQASAEADQRYFRARGGRPAPQGHCGRTRTTDPRLRCDRTAGR